MAGKTEMRGPVRFNLNPQEANEMFLSPLFVNQNLIGADWVKIMRNVKQEAVMYFGGAMSRIIQKNRGCGWDPKGEMPITQRTVTTGKHKINVQLCTDEFWDTCLEYLTGSEIDIYQLDTTELGRLVLNFWIERIQQGYWNDLFTLAFYADTASTNPFFAQGDGWLKDIKQDIADGLTPAIVPTGSGAPLAAGASVTIFEDMIAAQTDVFEDMTEDMKVFIVSKSIYNNYRDYLKANPAVSESWLSLQNGIMELKFCGIKVEKCPDFDKIDAELAGAGDQHRALLTFKETLTVATDIRANDTEFNVRFDEDTKLHKIEAFFRLGFKVAHPELVVLAE